MTNGGRDTRRPGPRPRRNRHRDAARHRRYAGVASAINAAVGEPTRSLLKAKRGRTEGGCSRAGGEGGVVARASVQGSDWEAHGHEQVTGTAAREQAEV